MPDLAPAAHPLVTAPATAGRSERPSQRGGRFVWFAAMQSPPLDDRTLRALDRAAESPLTADVVVRLMFAESGIAKALALPLEPGDHPSLDERPVGPGEASR